MSIAIEEIKSSLEKLNKSVRRNSRKVYRIIYQVTKDKYPSVDGELINKTIKQAFKAFKKEVKISYKQAIKNLNLQEYYLSILLKHYEICLLSRLRLE